MVRILVAGDVEGHLDLLYGRVATLHNSPTHGPFDMLFCVGPFYPPTGGSATAFEDYLCGTKEAPLPTYFFEKPPLSATEQYGEIAPGEDLCTNIKYLGPCGTEICGKLSVAFIGAQHTEEEKGAIEKMALNPGYMGVDLLLSAEWGQRVAAGMDLYSLFPSKVDPQNLGCADVADVAMAVKPRYHFAATHGVFFQRAPYRNHPAPPTKKTTHVTRFIALGKVSSVKDKDRRWLHALALDPVAYMSMDALGEEPPDCTNSPYETFASAKREGEGASSGQGSAKRARVTPGGMMEEDARRIEQEEERKRADSGMFFWGGRGGGGPSGGGGRRGGDRRDEPVDPNNTTVFVGGLRDGADPERLKKAFAPFGEVLNVRAPPGKDFAFIEFQTHAQAEAAIKSKGLTMMGGESIKLGWGKAPPPPREKPQRQPPPPPGPPPMSPYERPPGPPMHMHRRERFGQPPSEDESRCWFCLSSEKADTQLVLSIGEEMYLAMPKGPLVPEHLLLIPVAHTASLTRLSPEGFAEFEKWKKSIQSFYASLKMKLILFERRMETRTSTHTHVQMVPIPEDKAADVRREFEERGKKFNIAFEVIPPGKTLADLAPSIGEQQYFYLETPGLGGHGVNRLLYRLPPGARLPLQFGREVAAELLGMKDKVNWKDCVVSQEEEEKLVEKVREAYQPYDITLQDE